MILYPAIDLYDGMVVRLSRGDYLQKTVYSKSPEAMAKKWRKAGAEWIHLVDLEGAKTGILKNRSSILSIRKAVACRLEVGGGIRTLEDIGALIQDGIDRVILGTKALEEKFFKLALDQYGSKIAVSLDVKEGRVQTQGWLKPGEETLEEALTHFNHFPLETLIFTDIQKDGMLEGPNFEMLKKVLAQTNSKVILSGGVSTLEDIRESAKVKAAHFDGVIIGRALYEKKFRLSDALKIVRGVPCP